MNYNSPTELRKVLDDNSIGLKKRWGQNFLISAQTRQKIIDLLEITKGDQVWEIGPGLGSMTSTLADKVQSLAGACLRVFEIDHGLIRILREQVFKDRTTTPALDEPATEAVESPAKITIIEGDFVKTAAAAAARWGNPQRILGNLPYSSASAIILTLIETNLAPRKSVFTVQKELAERILSGPGSKNYSSFSILCQTFFQVRTAGDIKPGSFFPKPDVLSTILEFTPLPSYTLNQVRQPVFFKLVQALFRARRKKIKNNLPCAAAQLEIEVEVLAEALIQAGFDLSRRSEEYPSFQFVDVVNKLEIK